VVMASMRAVAHRAWTGGATLGDCRQIARPADPAASGLPQAGQPLQPRQRAGPYCERPSERPGRTLQDGRGSRWQAGSTDGPENPVSGGASEPPAGPRS
jgi:hypothetical protein